ncbi:MAG TPA: HD domain-containing phosphohydrolase [Gaiellaceae bacterium]|nr:HD domain-containing phosphohydrolase [Gaiellaceae bacterium]
MEILTPTADRRPPGRRGTWLLLGLGVLFAVYVVLLGLGPDSASGVVKWTYNILLVGAAAVCLISPAQRSAERAAWRCLGTTLLLWAAGDFYYTLFLLDSTVAPPTVTDWLWLASYPILYAGIALLVRARTVHFDRSLWLDAALAALAVAAVGAAVLFGAVVDSTGGSPLTAAMNVAYPLADALLLGLVVAVLAITGWRLDRTWVCILSGTGALTLADSGTLYQAAVGSGDSIELLDAAWPLAMLFLAAAAWQPPGRLGAVRAEGARVLALPAVFGLSALAILVYGQFAALNTPAVVLAATSLLAVIARMAFTFREKMLLLAKTRIEAQTDALTAVGNRRKLMLDLDAALAAQTTGVLMLLDLDGFKAYNDTFGHPAGDALLARIAEKLTAAVSSEGEVYRIGGDEFCVLAAVGPDRSEAFAAGAATSLEEGGEGFRISAAYGTVALPEEAASVADALRIVDGRMYDEKDGRRASAGRQSRDVLLRVLYERDARLQGHLSGLVELVGAAGTRIGLSDDELADVSLAAELHEVGKLAIPDSILLKPGPLTDDEWRFVRRHPLIGERILSSAPALAKVARLVRSTQERMDGMGYPDRLFGDDIPLGSRIIGACAAFVAMTSELAHRAARTPDEAIVELRRCAGSQFDANVVEALVAAYAELGADLALVAEAS